MQKYSINHAHERLAFYQANDWRFIRRTGAQKKNDYENECNFNKND